ncbi:NAD(P)-binding domain-containing protein [Lentzea indica]|uniref:NAD(P)-binding domain-containing protein n=1 Tax=Lentzea indica TaxID=2604800 RepID=UPI001FE58AEF|nr:NAD(P)-binding domain-containing protein [Lentzea indica]
MSSISVIGLGNMASALADRALAGGNAVEIIGRDQAKAKELAAALGGATAGTAGAPRPGTSSSSPSPTPARRRWSASTGMHCAAR